MAYQFTNPEHTFARYTSPEGNEVLFAVGQDTRYSVQYANSGETAADYVEPPIPVALTAQEKVENATNLTLAEIKEVLGITQLETDHQTLMNNNNGGY